MSYTDCDICGYNFFEVGSLILLLNSLIYFSVIDLSSGSIQVIVVWSPLESFGRFLTSFKDIFGLFVKLMLQCRFFFQSMPQWDSNRPSLFLTIRAMVFGKI